ncbi:MAG: MotA/TolQ/ExbB proton channel family protein [Sideroxydans sp.]|nr:MotA/TolQ/ExbB proton channel family protein [Sideroxydans sp.]
MSFTMAHDITMYLMTVAILLATYIIVERALYFSAVLREGKAVDQYLRIHRQDKTLRDELIQQFGSGKSPQAQALTEVAEANALPHDEMEYFVQSVYISKQDVLNRRLWILDTIVTLSPLMGLLGTILGIIDAFHSLSSGQGSADPAGVSRGIGTALFATGFGILIALYSMMFYNYFTNKVEQVNNQIKLISLAFLANRGA